MKNHLREPGPQRETRHSENTLDSSFLQEAARLGENAEKIDYLQRLERVDQMSPLLSRDRRAITRARSLISGRGWPTEKIRAFIFNKEQIEALGEEGSLPRMIGPNAVFIPRAYCANMSETALTRVILHEMVHARSAGLPGDPPPVDHIGLYQLQEGLTEMIANRMLPLPRELQKEGPLLPHLRSWAEDLVQKSGLLTDDIERMSQAEAVRVLSANLGVSPDQLGDWFQEQIIDWQQTPV